MYGGGERERLQAIHNRKVDDYVRVVHHSWSSSASFTGEGRGANSADAKPFWDLVVVTCQDEEQATHYAEEIKSRLRLRLLPCSARYFVVPDTTAQRHSKATVRLGNGGSTFSTLHWLYDRLDEELLDLRVLVIHSGGWSQRLPHTSACGKLFVSLPFSLPGRKMSTTMLEMKLIMLVDLPGAMQGPGVVCTCADDIQLFDSSSLSLPAKGFWAFAHPSRKQLGLTHGVFVLDRQEVEKFDSPEELDQQNVTISQFLHKPSFEEMKEAGIGCTFLSKYEAQGDIMIDSTFGFCWTVAKKFMKFYEENQPLQCELDMYGDVLRAMGTNSNDRYIEKMNSVIVAHPMHTTMRKLLYTLVQGVAFVAVPLVPSTWDHIGTMPEYLEHYCVTLPGYGFKRSISSPRLYIPELLEAENEALPDANCGQACPGRRSPSPPLIKTGTSVEELLESPIDGVTGCSSEACRLHSLMGPLVHIADGCVVEYCSFTGCVTVETGCVLSNIHLEQDCTIPKNMFMQTIPVQLGRAAPIEYVTVVLPTTTDIKRQLKTNEESTLMMSEATSLKHVMDRLSLSGEDVWPSGDGNLNVLRSLWNACLFPVTSTAAESTAEALQLIDLFCNSGTAAATANGVATANGTHSSAEGLQRRRISMVQALRAKNMQAFRTFRDEHDQAVVTTQLAALFRDQVDVMEWEHRVPYIRWLAGSPSGSCRDLRGSVEDIMVSYKSPAREPEFGKEKSSSVAEDEAHAGRVCSTIQLLFEDIYSEMSNDPVARHRLCVSIACLCARLSVVDDAMSRRLLEMSQQNSERGKDALKEGMLRAFLPELPMGVTPCKGASSLPFFDTLAQIMGEHYAPAQTPLTPGARGDCNLPIRINLAGAWTDTPPYALENGGAVVNCALSLDGDMPVKVTATAIEEPRFRLVSSDLRLEESLTDEDLVQALVGSLAVDTELGLHKAVISLMLFPSWIFSEGERQSSTFEEKTAHVRDVRETLFGKGRGMELRTDVSCIPKGTGLGTSSILFLACVGAVMRLLVPSARLSILKGTAAEQNFLNFAWNSVLVLEQVLGSCGGWQDQVGGGTSGVKLVTTQPGLVPEYSIKALELDEAHERVFNERLVAIYSGPREKTAQQVLFSIAEHWATRSFNVPETLAEIYGHATSLFPLLQRFENTPIDDEQAMDAVFEELGQQLSLAKSLAEKLERKTTTPWLEELTSASLRFCSGCNAMGAGSGGFLIGYLKPGVRREEMQAYFEEEYPTTSLYCFKLCSDEIL